MKKSILAWIIAFLVFGGAATAYVAVPAVRGFVDGLVDGLAGSDEDETYWCPMHPEVVRHQAGSCPV